MRLDHVPAAKHHSGDYRRNKHVAYQDDSGARPSTMRSKALRIPRYLHEIAGHKGEDDFRAWVDSLPNVVAELTQRWALHVGEPYEPGGQCSWVAPARISGRENGAAAEVVLKVGWRHPEAEREADGLRAWHGNGAVRLYAAQTFDQTRALLLEQCIPGTPLGRSMPESEQDVVVAGLLKRLWTQRPDGYPFQPLQVMCETWAVEFERRLARPNGDIQAIGIDPGLARTAMDLFRELPQSAGAAVLLSTDLHGGNVLAAQREPWLTIDPKPYVGDPTYDALQHMLNCEERLAVEPEKFAQLMADLLDLDTDRLRLWLFARCTQFCLEQPELYEVAVRLAP